LVLVAQVPAEKIDRARALAQVPGTDSAVLSSYPLTKEAVNEIVALPLGFDAMIAVYVLEIDR
jgi:hypothetical protein